MYKIAIVVGSIGRGRNTPRLARLIARHVAAHPEAEAELLDLAELDIPLLEERLRNIEDPPADLVRFAAVLGNADALVVVTPEYNKLIPAALKNALDALGGEIRRKPAAIATHSVGDFGGTVVLQFLRPLLMNLGAVPIPAVLSVPRIARAVDEDGSALEEVFDDRGQRFVAEIVEYAGAFRSLRGSR